MLEKRSNFKYLTRILDVVYFISNTTVSINPRNVTFLQLTFLRFYSIKSTSEGGRKKGEKTNQKLPIETASCNQHIFIFVLSLCSLHVFQEEMHFAAEPGLDKADF